MDQIYWIEQQGIQILFSDYADLSAEEIVATAEETDRDRFPKYRSLPQGSVAALVDVTHAVASKDAVAALKRSAKLWTPLYRQQAVLGLTGFHRVFLTAVNRFSGGNFVPFDSREAALKWLIEK